jgi:hypothetical protein
MGVIQPPKSKGRPTPVVASGEWSVVSSKTASRFIITEPRRGRSRSTMASPRRSTRPRRLRAQLPRHPGAPPQVTYHVVKELTASCGRVRIRPCPSTSTFASIAGRSSMRCARWRRPTRRSAVRHAVASIMPAPCQCSSPRATAAASPGRRPAAPTAAAGTAPPAPTDFAHATQGPASGLALFVIDWRQESASG